MTQTIIQDGKYTERVVDGKAPGDGRHFVAATAGGQNGLPSQYEALATRGQVK